jgi:multidrug efflux system outer membrane protein
MLRTVMSRLSLAGLVLLAGCVAPVNYERPPVELPDTWKEIAPPYAADGRWWRIYQDADLDRVVDEALLNNSDLLVAVARVEEARGLLGEANSFLFPSVDLQAGVSRQQVSTRTATSFPGVPREYSNHRATLNVAWEIDLFGRLRAGTAVARAELEANEASRDAVRLTLAAQAAKSYFALRALDEQVELTRRTVRLRDEALALQRRRHAAGVTSEFELRQLEAETAAVRAQLPPLERDREREETALAVLLGRTPKEIFTGTVRVRQTQDDTLLEAPVVPSGLPSELLLRRPDLVGAERQLAAANARVAVARSEMFPRINLTAFLGGESQALSNLFAGGAPATWQIAAGLTQPIFAGGRLAARSEAAKARERAALSQYEQAIRAAFGDVRSALAAQARSRESYEAETARAAALTETLRLARLRYDNGIASQLDVLDAERGLLAARSARIEALRAHRAAVADLFRALGG